MTEAVIFDIFETLATHFRCPLYFGEQMAQDAGIPEEDFRRVWDTTGDDRTLGKVTFEAALEKTLSENGKYSVELFDQMVAKRIETKKACFRRLHKDIMPMLSAIKVKGLSVGAVSNCFSEEVPVIKDSVLYPFFDAACFSCEEGVMKPGNEIFIRCTERLGVSPWECVYVGDGGSFELEAARDIGMTPYQAVWYFTDHPRQRREIKEGFIQLESPLDVLKYI